MSRDGRLESIRMTPVIRAFVTWSCGVGPISSGRPGEGCSHVRRLPLPRPTTSGCSSVQRAGIAAGAPFCCSWLYAPSTAS
ncbi:hypothetical protein ALC62_07649 [Cyphomyrmex costatus]|uniref:Uncharacterized protein n=1 Tax=Cyphomyrmex costatus TaxID=456900 RepID=A0A195CLX1_9HYME|nr:hypothetical protein ALC62_07649 [Cyphomyrmex costatus]